MHCGGGGPTLGRQSPQRKPPDGNARRAPHPRSRASWCGKRLNDPETLKQCIPGCESIEKVSDTEFTAKVRAKVGPVSARFAGKVTLSDLDPPSGYTISGEGTGGVAGFAKGGAKVALDEEGGETVLRYGVQAQVGGKLAQIGSRLDRRHRAQDGRRILQPLRRRGDPGERRRFAAPGASA